MKKERCFNCKFLWLLMLFAIVSVACGQAVVQTEESQPAVAERYPIEPQETAEATEIQYAPEGSLYGRWQSSDFREMRLWDTGMGTIIYAIRPDFNRLPDPFQWKQEDTYFLVACMNSVEYEDFGRIPFQANDNILTIADSYYFFGGEFTRTGRQMRPNRKNESAFVGTWIATGGGVDLGYTRAYTLELRPDGSATKLENYTLFDYLDGDIFVFEESISTFNGFWFLDDDILVKHGTRGSGGGWTEYRQSAWIVEPLDENSFKWIRHVRLFTRRYPAPATPSPLIGYWDSERFTPGGTGYNEMFQFIMDGYVTLSGYTARQVVGFDWLDNSAAGRHRTYQFPWSSDYGVLTITNPDTEDTISYRYRVEDDRLYLIWGEVFERVY
ncbi:MAG: hypothetical protein FWB96_13040 [Defluviitaleaceae bacterium]|nr:hypothetical protein [Defluviitaleaceae bacterium]MCL2264128.1 hypothetical protein [Defluviitaleaceae bacterium]